MEPKNITERISKIEQKVENLYVAVSMLALEMEKDRRMRSEYNEGGNALQFLEQIRSDNSYSDTLSGEGETSDTQPNYLSGFHQIPPIPFVSLKPSPPNEAQQSHSRQTTIYLPTPHTISYKPPQQAPPQELSPTQHQCFTCRLPNLSPQLPQYLQPQHHESQNDPATFNYNYIQYAQSRGQTSAQHRPTTCQFSPPNSHLPQHFQPHPHVDPKTTISTPLPSEPRPRFYFPPLPASPLYIYRQLRAAGKIEPIPQPAIRQPPPRSFNPQATCEYHSNALGHETNSCIGLRRHLKKMIDQGELKFAPRLS